MVAWLPEHEVLFTAEEIEGRVQELADRISEDYRGKLPVLVCVLHGAFVFMADLIRRLKIPVRVDFIGMSSYGDDSSSSGAVKITKDLDVPIDGRDVIIVEDIIDTGLTLSYLMNLLAARKPASLNVCALLDKPSRRVMPVSVKYVGYEIEDRFIVGYGLDCARRYREVPFLFVLNEQEQQPTSEGEG